MRATSKASERHEIRPAQNATLTMFDPGPAQAGCCPDHGYSAAPLDKKALISARALCLHRSGKIILDHVDIDLDRGEIVTLIGPNGSGKTTLVRLLLCLEAPTSGTIYRRAGLKSGYVPQRFDIDRALPMTVERFLSLGQDVPRNERSKRIMAALEEVGAVRCAPQQLGELSGGELQRVLLARALLASPDLLVLDEPARGVDVSGEADLYRLISDLRDRRGIGVLLISHDLNVVMASSDRVLCLNRHICCSGIPEAVSQHPEYLRLFGPDIGRALAIYRHHHDHSHALDGSAETDRNAHAPQDRDPAS